MVDETGPPIVSFAGGFFSGRFESSLRESAQQTWYNLLSVDVGGAQTGATITSAMVSQATGYQIQASYTRFSTVTPAVSGNGNTPTAACVLPQTNRPFPMTGLILYIVNNTATPINCYPHPNDTNNSINAQAANTPVILGAFTTTEFNTDIAGTWWADGIGEGFANSIATVVSQGNITASTTNTQAAATPIVQAMAGVLIASANNAVALPKANQGLQVVVNPTGAGNIAGNTPLNVYPQNGSGDSINGGAGNALLAVTLQATFPTVFYCFTTGAWWTK
jgi:hypothetical protein